VSEQNEQPPEQNEQQMRVANPSAVKHPESGGMMVPDPRRTYAADDPLVKAYPWMFEPAGERRPEAGPPDSVSIERATRAPGERRRTRRPRRGAE
jgi:hypothetical protein